MKMKHVPYTKNKTKILLVEDNRVDAAIVKALLTENGDLDVTRVITFKEAVSALMEKPYDAILLDLGLPDSTGAESIFILKKKFPEIPIIILSGNDEQVEALRTLQYGAEQFLSKGQTDSESIRNSIFTAISGKAAPKPVS